MSKLHDPDAVSNLKGLIGDEKFSIILSSSRASLESIVTELKNAYQEQDHETMRRAVHSIKSSVGNYGAIKVSQKAEELELRYKDNLLDQAETEIPEIEAMVQQVLAELDEYL
ncbi:Hpt domain-containing protein [Litoribacillus peritrichatus]|uniref:HPt domain-containing protein n=1 Tax=Litoribacillus peritrichatus TaxID=718191 RepID=A0ABP7NEU9_9GAMM